MKRKYNYFYKITNLINNHFYYGIHSTNNLEDGYMGSGSRLQIAYKKYGIENFSKEIIKFFDTRKEALEYEAKVVNENLIKDDCCYNLVIGGSGDYHEEHICKPNKTSLKPGEVIVKKKGTNKFFVINKHDIIDISKYEFTWNNKHHKEESKNKVREKMTPKNSKNPRVWVCKDNKVKYLLKTKLDEYLKDGWQLGRVGYKPRKNCQGKCI